MFWNNFVLLCNSKNRTPTSVISELNISRGSVTHWKSGKVPHHSTLIKIADYFGVSVDYLLKGDDDTAESRENIFKEDRKVSEVSKHPLNTKAKAKSIEEIERRVEAVKLVSGSLALQELIRDIVDTFYDDIRNTEWWIAEELHNGFCVCNGESVEETCDRLDEAILDKEECTDTPFKLWVRTVQPKKNEETPETRYLRSLGATSV